uniref:Uncharacterized protein n=1 Tax=viral metagenome TaxID=1070528 RepID=A0A6M3KYY7_9ZZZZ
MTSAYTKLLSDLEDAIQDWKSGMYEEKQFNEKVDGLICQLYWYFRGSNKEDLAEGINSNKEELFGRLNGSDKEANSNTEELFGALNPHYYKKSENI